MSDVSENVRRACVQRRAKRESEREMRGVRGRGGGAEKRSARYECTEDRDAYYVEQACMVITHLVLAGGHRVDGVHALGERRVHDASEFAGWSGVSGCSSSSGWRR